MSAEGVVPGVRTGTYRLDTTLYLTHYPPEKEHTQVGIYNNMAVVEDGRHIFASFMPDRAKWVCRFNCYTHLV